MVPKNSKNEWILGMGRVLFGEGSGKGLIVSVERE